MAQLKHWFALVTVMGGLVGLATPLAAQVAFTDANPSSSDLDAVDPDGASSGRINGLAAPAGNNDIAYAATEFGGLYKTVDAGLTWSFLSGHRPLSTWDVEVNPANTQVVYATSGFDGRTAPLSGINVSLDAGSTWAHPATATPPAAFNCSATRRAEPAAFGIATRPDAANNVFVGTNCGLAVSADSGTSWSFVDPTPLTAATNVWDVAVQPGGPNGLGIIDVCGDDGHFRSVDGGVVWTGGTGILPSGRCSIAASPDESYVLLVAAADNNIYESDDAGASWTNLGTPDFQRQGRVPFVETNQRSDDATGNRFDLWYGDIRLFRGLCRTPAVPATGGAPRCPGGPTGAVPKPYVVPAGYTGPLTRCLDPDGTACAHDDVGAILFDSEDADGIDACPVLFSSDGGVFRNTDAGADCQDPDWEQPNVTPHALYVWSMDGAPRAGVAGEDLYMVLQDNGIYGTTNAGAATVAWHNERCCDGFSTASESDRVLYIRGFFLSGRGFLLFSAGAGMVGETQVNNYPADGLLPVFNFDEAVQRYADDSYVVITNDCNPTGSNGVDDDGDTLIDEPDENNGCTGVNGGDGGIYITSDITASPIVWTELGNATEPPTARATEVQVAVDGAGTPTFYVLSGDGSRTAGASLWRFDGTNPAGAWRRVDNNDGLVGGFNTFAVDPKNPERLYASLMAFGGPQIVFSVDGGTTWDRDLDLENLMSGSGAFLLRTSGYPQPSMFAFDPFDSNIVIAGARDAGIFVSLNGGDIWKVATDPLSSDTSGIPHLPRPFHAYFDHDSGQPNVYIGTQGRGVWKMTITAQPPVAVCANATVDANASCQGSVTAAKVDAGSFDPDGPPPNCQVDSTGPFGLGDHAVTLTCTDSTGLTDSCQSIVTVRDVTPPTLNCPVSVNVNCTSRAGAVATFSATATDNCSGVGTPVCTPPSGSTFALGTRLDACSVSDGSGNPSACSFNVTVALADNPVCCPLGTNVILGTSNNDTLNGGTGSDCILGRGAQDTINGNGGNDFISGGDGDDIINAGTGNDLVFGGSGQDRLTGGTGDDVMSGGDGDDQCFGSDGNDTLLGGQGQDRLFGENNDDTLVGETGDDTLDGGNGNDLLTGGGLHDTCIGGPGTDTFLTCQNQTQ